MDPAHGVVLGEAWGDPARPGLATEVALLGARWHVARVYELDALVAVVLTLAEDASDGLVDAISHASVDWLGVPLTSRDEAYWIAEAGCTRLSWDGLDGRLTFEDVD